MTSKWWSSNIFKGRIGEAVIESILIEFGYIVRRSGYEQTSSGSPRIAPDLLVTHPGTGERFYVEVKYRSARPTEVLIEGGRLAEYRANYPGTILAINSSWDGGIYCSKVEDIPVKDHEGTAPLNLTADYWKPIWQCFPLVKQGEQLKETWRFLRDIMAAYGTRQIFGRQDQKLWGEEYEALTSYIEASWDEQLEGLGIPEPQPERATLEELWESVRQINASELADELLEPTHGEVISGIAMHQTMQRILNRRGEAFATFDLAKICEGLRLGQDELSKILAANLVTNLQKTQPDGNSRRIWIEALPDGIQGAYLMDQSIPFEETPPVDLKTVLLLITSQCRID